MKRKFVGGLILPLFMLMGMLGFVNTGKSQTIIYTTDFGSVANVNPSGWSFTGIDMTISTNTTSSGYTAASGGAYLGEGNSTTFTNTSGTTFGTSQVGISTATLQTSTTGFTNIVVSFGMRKSSASYNTNATYSLEWSSDGTTFFPITYTESTAGNWGLASGAGLTLPAGAENQATLFLKWTFNRTGTASNYKIDDFTVSGGTPPLPPANLSFASTHQTVNENAGTATVNIGITSSNVNPSSVNVVVNAVSTVSGSDYTIGSATVSFPGSATGNLPFTITLNNDVELEQTEYFVLEFTNFVNAQAGTTTRHYLYVKDNDRTAPQSTNELSMQLLSSYQNGTEGSNSTEIVAHDVASQRLFIANSVGNKLDILNFSNPAAITSINSISLAAYGNINSIAVHNGIVALAVENNTTSPQDPGKIVFMDINGNFVSSVTAGAMPDMIMFNHAGTKVISACEGEPNINFTTDPEGSVTVVDISGGVASITQANATQITFTSFNGQEAALRTQGIRIFGAGSTAAMDFEPEYVTISDDDLTAWVTLQENNAIAKIDLTTNTVTQLFPLGLKNHSLLGNGMDISDQTNAINIANFPVKGMYLPDAITQFTIGGQTYLMTANEGDAREYTGTPGFIEVFRLGSGSVVLDPTVFPNGNVLKQNLLAGRLNVTNKTGDTDNDGDLDEIHVFGTRSFSIWNATTGSQVFDSGDDFEMISASHPTYSTLFNASNTSGAAAAKNRSDDKGPEPEGVTTANINGHQYAFISMERVGGVMSYNIDDPANPVFASYFNNRSFASNGPDRGAEGMVFIAGADSPNGNDILLLANEISSSLTVYQVDNCQTQSNVSIIPSDSTGFCAGSQVTLQTATQANVTYQWMNNGIMLTGQNTTSLNVSAAGNYSLAFVNTTNQCAAETIEIEVTQANLPAVTGNSTDIDICSGDNITLTGSGAQTYVWDHSVIDNQSFSLASSTNFTVAGTDANGCVAQDQISINVNALPNVIANANDNSICPGANVTLTGSGANSYSWDNSVTNGTSFIPGGTQTYTVTGTDLNGCENTGQILVTVNSLPVVVANASDNSICAGDEITLYGTGAQNYAWNSGVINFDPFIPAGTQTYTVTGTDINGCVDTDQISVTVNNLPNPVISNGTGVIQTGIFITYQWYLNGNGIVGADSQTYDPSVDGTYTVVVTDANGCEAESAPFVYSSLGISENILEGNVTIAPNPFSENTIISFETMVSGHLNMELYNYIGQRVMSIENKEISAGKYSYQLNSINDVSGIYFLKVEFDNHSFSYRLVELH